MQPTSDPIEPLVSPSPTSGYVRPGGRDIVWLVVVAAAYAASAWVGLRWSLADGVVSPVWPAAGVALAALVLGGVRLWPAILLGAVVAFTVNDSAHPMWPLWVMGAGNALAAAVAAWVLRTARFSPALGSFRDVLLLVGMSVLSGVIAATVGAFAAQQGGMGSASTLGVLWTNWFFGDLTGALVVAPLVLAWSRGRVPRSRRWWAQFIGCLALSAAIGVMVFVPPGGERTFTFLTFCPLIWAALSLRLRGATVVVLLVAALGVWGTTAGTGPFAEGGRAVRFVDLQVYVAIIAAATLILAVVADERRAQQALMLSEARLRLALDASHTGLWKLDMRSGEMTFSPECARVTGLTADAVDHTRAGVMQLVHAEDQAGVRAAFWQAVQGAELFEAVFRLVCPDGRTVWIEARGRATFDGDGNPQSMLGSITDITDRKRSERQLADQARLLDLTSDAVIIRDMQGHISYWNDGAQEMYGYTREQVIGRVSRALLHSQFYSGYHSVEETLLRTDRWAGEIRQQHRDGSAIVVHARWALNRDVLGRPVSVLQTHTDITARKRTESNARFLVELDAVIARAQSAEEIAEGGLRLVGEYFELLRCTLSDIDIVHGRIRTMHEWTNGAPRVSGTFDARDFFASELGATLASGEAVAVADLRTDPMTASHADNYLPYGTAALAAASYVTEGRLAGTLTVASGTPRDWRKDEMQLMREIVARLCPAIERAKAVAALRESEARFRQMADTAPMMIWVAEADGDWSYVSRRWSEFTGRLPEVELGAGWLDVVHADDRSGVQTALKAATENHEPFRCEFRALRWDGAHRWMLATGRPRHGARSEFLGFIGATIDITERREAEEALRAADRRKDEFLATLAHELRNPLSPIRTGLQVLNLTRDEQAARAIREMMERQLGHMVRLIDDLLDVSRITSGKVVLQRERMTLQEAARAAVESTRPLIEGAKHHLEVSLPEQTLWVDADPTRLAQVLGNLLTNAAKYTPDGGLIRLDVEPAGGCAIVRVSDTGMGIPPDAIGEVFGMFAQVNRTLDRAQGGLGIGLALARRLVEMHGGTVSAHSDGLGLGSTFTVTLPLAADVEHPHQVLPAPAGPSRCLRALVVDDNVDAAEMLAMMLELEGHSALSASSGAEALEVVAGFDPQIVFLDIGMPGMSGHEVARRLRAQDRFSDTYLVAVSGWGGEEDKRLAREAGFDLHLTKPVSVSAIQRVVADAGADLRVQLQDL